MIPRIGSSGKKSKRKKPPRRDIRSSALVFLDSRWLWLRGLASRVHAEKERGEDDEDAHEAWQRYRVVVEYAREQDGERLPQRHDDGEDDGAVLWDREEDEELTDSGAHLRRWV